MLLEKVLPEKVLPEEESPEDVDWRKVLPEEADWRKTGLGWSLDWYQLLMCC